MITLHNSASTNFSTLGIGSIPDYIKTTVTEELNGAFELTMTYPITGKRYNDLLHRRILYCKPNPYTSAQPFRIYSISKPINRIVTIYACHISYDLSGYPVNPFTATSPNDAFTKLKSNAQVSHPFTFNTTDTSKGNINVKTPKSSRYVLGNNILAAYQGEFEFDGFMVYHYPTRGMNRGFSIRYGKNLLDIKQEENIASVYTGVYPYWEGQDDEGNSSMVILTEKTINTPGTFDFTRILPLDMSSDFQNKPTETELRDAATKYITDNDIGTPTVSIDVSFIQLSKSTEYANYAVLEKVMLGDTLTVRFAEANINATARCIKTVYNVGMNRYETITLGEAKSNLAVSISDTNRDVANKIEQQKLFFDAQVGTIKINIADIDTALIGKADIDYVTANYAHLLNGYIDNAQIKDASIGTAKIADAAITVAKIQSAFVDSLVASQGKFTSAQIGQLDATNIKAGSITSNEIAANTIVAADIAAGTITATQIAANTITGDRLVAGTITATQIATGTITANKVAAGTITADKMLIGDNNNLCIIDPNTSALTTASGTVLTPVTNTAESMKYFQSGTGAYSALELLVTPTVDFSINDEYQLRFLGCVDVSGCSATFIIRYKYSDSTYTNAGSVAMGFGLNTAPLTTTMTSASIIEQTLTCKITTAPTAGKTISRVVFFIEKGNTTTGSFYIRDIKLLRKGNGSLIVDGSITANQIKANTITATQIAAGTITATQIATDTITANQIAANAITATEIASNAVTAGKIAAGSIEADRLSTAAVNSISVTASNVTANAITAGTIKIGNANITDGTIDGAKITSATIQAAQIKDATITSAKISSLDVSKLNAGTIDTSKIKLASTDGVLSINNNLIQIKDAQTTPVVRVQIGKDATNNYGIIVQNASGVAIFDSAKGVLVPAGLADNVVSESKIVNEAVGPSKLQIDEIWADTAYLTALRATTINSSQLVVNTIRNDLIDLEGLISFSSLDSDMSKVFDVTSGKTYINGGMIATNTIKANSIDLLSGLTVKKSDGTITFSVASDGGVTVNGLLQSSNYVADSNGYKISTDGSAEFNQIKAVGTVSNNKAGITNEGTADNSVRFWAGSDYNSRATAPFRVYQNGDVFAANGTFTGVLNGTLDSGDVQIFNNAITVNASGSETEKVRINATQSIFNTDIIFGTTSAKGLVYDNANKTILLNTSVVQNHAKGSITTNTTILNSSSAYVGYNISSTTGIDGGAHRMKYWDGYGGLIFESTGTNQTKSGSGEKPYDFKFERAGGDVNVKVAGKIEVTNSIQSSNQTIEIRSVANEGWGYYAN